MIYNFWIRLLLVGFCYIISFWSHSGLLSSLMISMTPYMQDLVCSADSHISRYEINSVFTGFYMTISLQKWREYEHAHTLCWLGKDLSWNRLSPVPWIICLIPTLVIAADFIFVTFRTKVLTNFLHTLFPYGYVLFSVKWKIVSIIYRS